MIYNYRFIFVMNLIFFVSHYKTKNQD